MAKTNKEEQERIKVQVNEQEEQKQVSLEESYTRAEQFVENNKLPLTIGLVVLGLGLAAFLYYTKKMVPEKNAEAIAEVYKAQMYFEQDSFQLALTGDGEYLGFEDIINDYKGTKTANLSKYYAGVSHLNMGNYQEAIDYLKGYKSKDMIVGSMAVGAMGDAYSELGDNGQAIAHYKKAANRTKNNLTTPMFLWKAGRLSQIEGNNAEAASMFQRIKDDYPNSSEGKDIEKYLALAKAAS